MFSIEEEAKKYVYGRFSHASINEKEKIVRDWKNKMVDSRSLVEDFIKRIGSPSGKKILDAGSGNGGISIAFAKAGAYPTGIEIEEELYDIGKRYAASEAVKIDTVLYEGFKMPFEDDHFDHAVSVSVLEHTTDPVLYLSEILRVVKKGGSLYLGFPNKLWPKETHTGLWLLTYLPSFLRSLIVSLFKRNPLGENNLHFYTYFNLQRMIKKARGEFKWEIVEEKGSSTSFVKNLTKKILGVFGISYKAFLPHILVILRKDEK